MAEFPENILNIRWKGGRPVDNLSFDLFSASLGGRTFRFTAYSDWRFEEKNGFYDLHINDVSCEYSPTDWTSDQLAAIKMAIRKLF
jgi:hypothetical protein